MPSQALGITGGGIPVLILFIAILFQSNPTDEVISEEDPTAQISSSHPIRRPGIQTAEEPGGSREKDVKAPAAPAHTYRVAGSPPRRPPAAPPQTNGAGGGEERGRESAKWQLGHCF